MNNPDAVKRLHAAVEDVLARPNEVARMGRYFKMASLLHVAESATSELARKHAQKALSRAVDAARKHARKYGHYPNTLRTIRAEVRATLEALNHA